MVGKFIAVMKEAGDWRHANLNEAVTITADYLSVDPALLAPEAQMGTTFTSADLAAKSADGAIAGWLTAGPHSMSRRASWKTRCPPRISTRRIFTRNNPAEGSAACETCPVPGITSMNVLYIDINSLRRDHLGCYGYHRDTSPNIDALAAEGVRFENVYVSDVPCHPSRCGRGATAFATRGPLDHRGDGGESPAGLRPPFAAGTDRVFRP
jgi:hypothetical protein